MENLSLEEKIASFTKKIDDLDQSAPASGGAGAAGGGASGPQEPLYEAPEFEKGKIAAMKNRLVQKGLSVDPDGKAVEEKDLAGGAGGGGGGGEGGGGRGGGGGVGGGGGGYDHQVSPKDAAEADKAAKLASEFQTGKIAAMKNRLVAQGLSVEDSGGESRSAGGSAKGAASPAPSPLIAVGGSSGKPAPAPSPLTAVDDSSGKPAVEAPKSPGTSGDAAEMAKETSTKSPEIGDDVAPASNGEEGGADDVVAETSPQRVEKETPTVVPVYDLELAKDSSVDSVAGEKPPSPSSPTPAPTLAPPSPAAPAAPVAPTVVTPEVADAVPPVSEGAIPSAQSPTNDQPAAPAAAPAPAPAPAPTVVPDDPAPVGNGDRTVVPHATEPAPVQSKLPGRPGAKASTPGASPRTDGSSTTASKAKAVLAASKARARPASASSGTSQRQQQRRASTPERKTSLTPLRPATGGRSASPAPKPKVRRPPSPAGSASGRRHSEATAVKRRVSPAAGSVSRATPAIPITLGLHASPAAAAGKSPAQRRRSSTPAKLRTPSASQQQEKMVTPARSSVAGSAASAVSHGVVLTPASAEQSGNRLHEQAREARERMERRRKEGASPPSTVSGLAPFGAGVVLTPSSAEQSGKRLHEQAQEARERLERRRKESFSPVVATAAGGESPFTPRRWSNPKMGNPSVAGMERLESLYRDATQRNSRLEIARRALQEKPLDCTFTPEIGRRASSRGRGEKRSQRGDDGGRDARSMSCFHALYLDAKRRRAKIEALVGAQLKEERAKGSPSITARGRQASVEPLDVRMKENAERWTRRWQELEEKRIEKEQEGCTFMPNFSIGRSASAPRLRSRRDSGGSNDSPGGIKSFVARSLRFQAARERKMEKLKQEAMEKELAETTFQPKLTSREGEGAAAADGAGNVFERLLLAATMQEVNKAALKEEFLRQEREKFHDFQPRLPTRQVEGPTAPLDARIQKSTEDWFRSRAVRDQRRAELEDEQCTFHPTLGGGGGGGAKRSSSVEPHQRPRSSRRATTAGPEPFAARAAAFQEAKEQRLEGMRREKMKQDMEEVTFQPTIGANGLAQGGGVGAFEGGHDAAAAAGTAGAAAAAGGADTSGVALAQPDLLGSDMRAAQDKVAASAREKKEAIGFKPQGGRRPASVRSRDGSGGSGNGKQSSLARKDADAAYRRGREMELNRQRACLEPDKGAAPPASAATTKATRRLPTPPLPPSSQRQPRQNVVRGAAGGGATAALAASVAPEVEEKEEAVSVGQGDCEVGVDPEARAGDGEVGADEGAERGIEQGAT